MAYINCPTCGHRLMEGEDIGLVKVKCAKCKRVAAVSIQGDKVLINTSLDQPKQPSADSKNN